MIKNLGKLAEYLVLSELLKKNIEAYPSITFQQEDYDIVVINQQEKVIRIQVKATDLQNKSTNNKIKNIGKNYAILIIVIKDKENYRFFIMTKGEAIDLSKNGTLSISELKKGISSVKYEFSKYENKWDVLT